jgi:hypothetical protein
MPVGLSNRGGGQVCFIANSVKTEIVVEKVVAAA